MTIGLLKESGGDNRVALLPEHIIVLKKLNTDILVEQGAGSNSFFNDKLYSEAGALIKSREEVIAASEMLLLVTSPDDGLLKLIKGKNKVIIGTMNPLSGIEISNRLKSEGLSTFSLDLIPRSSRAQAMDVLSSMATVAGYKAVLEAALRLPRFFPMFMSAAGTIKPAKVLILGAGVAGLQATATARKLGAIVEVFDVRSAVKEEVKSLGGKFIEVEGATEDKGAGGYAVEQTDDFKARQAEMIHDHAAKSNVIICTAQIPGRKAPLLIHRATVEAMAPGSVIIDLAASTGGNCEMTQDEKSIVHNGITIIGQSDYPSMMVSDASKMYGTNITNFIKLLINEEGGLNLDFEDDIIKGTCLTHNGELVNERVKTILKA